MRQGHLINMKEKARLRLTLHIQFRRSHVSVTFNNSSIALSIYLWQLIVNLLELVARKLTLVDESARH